MSLYYAIMLRTFGKDHQMRYLIILFAILSLWQFSGFKLLANEPSTQLPFDKELKQVILTAKNAEDLCLAFDRWKNWPTYLRISAAKSVLLPLLQSQGSSELPRIADVESRHDLRSVSGRAAWAFEHLFEVPLPPASTANQPSTPQAAKLLLEAFEAGAASLDKDLDRGDRVKALAEKYKNRIRTGISREDAETSTKSMQELLIDWYPLGKRIATLEVITGVKIPIKDGIGEIRFDNGFSGTVFQFHVDADGVITSVTAASLY